MPRTCSAFVITSYSIHYTKLYDGFVIAQRDLEIRGPGELLGTRQTGLADLKIADLARDQPLIPLVQRLARRLLDEHPGRVAPLIRRWLGQREA